MSYLTTGEAARMCGVGLNSIKRWVRQGRIPHMQTPGGHWRIPREAFLSFIDGLRDEAGESSPTGPCVLVVDDDAHSCEFVRGAMACTPIDCRVECAHDGYTGLIQIGRLRPALLVLDIMMPEINGLELLHRLRARPELCDGMKVLVYTGAGDRRLVMRKVKESRPDAVLLKPCGVEEFLQAALPLLQPAAACAPGTGAL